MRAAVTGILRRAGVWLFGRRPVQPQRPVRRWVPLAFVAALVITYAAGVPLAGAAVAFVAGALLVVSGML